MQHTNWQGAGLGLRRELIGGLIESVPDGIDFLEVAPENWIGVGGRSARALRILAERLPVVAHGLCLNLGGYRPLDLELVAGVGRLMDELGMPFYSEHLACTADAGTLYDLMPIPFTGDAVRHVAARIRTVQDALGHRIGVENVSYYAASPIDEMDEADFLRAVIEEADCLLHLDVNNLYVNSVNHGLDPEALIAGLPGERIAYLHIAGHHREHADLIIDTHGAAVIDPVWDLLDFTYRRHGLRPTLLERDFNIPPLATLAREVRRIGGLQAANRAHRHVHAA